MGTHVIVGAGAVGSGVARRLADVGHDVVVVTRSGTAPQAGGISAVAADASDPIRLTALAQGADALYNCANPPYHRWKDDWPPLAAAFLTAAETSGARLVTISNLYGFAEGTNPMRATDELRPTNRKGAIRADMWRDALEAHRTGRIRATEVRASDYVGPGLGETSHMGDRTVPRVLAGKSVRFIGDPSVGRSWTYIDDVCDTMVTAATDDRALGRAWHVPSIEPISASDYVGAIAAEAGVDRAQVGRIPNIALRLGGLFVPVLRELPEMLYQFTSPFVIDATDTTETFGIEATPLAEQVRSIVSAYREAVPA